MNVMKGHSQTSRLVAYECVQTGAEADGLGRSLGLSMWLERSMGLLAWLGRSWCLAVELGRSW